MSLSAFGFNRTLKVGLQKLSTQKLPDQMLRALLTHDSILCSSAPLIMTPSAASRRAKASAMPGRRFSSGSWTRRSWPSPRALGSVDCKDRERTRKKLKQMIETLASYAAHSAKLLDTSPCTPRLESRWRQCRQRLMLSRNASVASRAAIAKSSPTPA